MKRKLALILSLAMVALIAVGALTGCNDNGDDTATTTTTTAQEENGTQEGEEQGSGGVASIGEGETSFTFEVTNNEGNVSVWSVYTNETTVGAALLEVGLVEGNDTEWGLMVSTVNGLTADFEANGAWWSFLVDGEMSMVGVDSTYIEPGVTYAFVYTIE